jgi:hypothetical protein
MLNTMIVASVTNFSGTTTPDKNGAVPVMLQCIAGTMPNRNVLSGTVAQRAGFEVGKTYLVNVRETGYDDIFGPDFTFVKVMELKSGLDIVQSSIQLGEPRILYVQRPEGFDEHYQRKGDAVESNRTVRMREGLYHPTVQTTVNQGHRTAREVKDGTSVGSGGTIVNAEDWLKQRNIQSSGDYTPHPDDMEMEFPEPENNSEFPEFEDEKGDEEVEGEEVNPSNPIKDAKQEVKQREEEKKERRKK